MSYLSLPYVLLYAIAILVNRKYLPKWLLSLQCILLIFYFFLILLKLIISINPLFFYYNIHAH